MSHEPVQELFKRAAGEFAGEVAIDLVDERLTYGELAARTNRLANFLSGAVARGSLVAVAAEDRLAPLISLIGTLKAGCVFVPFDARWPEKKLRAMLDEVRPDLFLSEGRFVPLLGGVCADGREPARVVSLDGPPPDEARPHVIDLTADYEACDDEGEPRVAASSADDLCYVYFTSGSTGRPKGIAGRLKAIDHFIRWEIKTLGVGRGTRVSQLIAPTFDAYLRDVFTPLCAGGTVCLPPERELALDPRRLAAWLEDGRVNLIHCVPTLFRTLLKEPPPADYFAALKYVLLSGERLLPADVRRWTDIFGERVQLVNLYGPSETTMTKFFYFVKPSDKDRRFIPIGKPMEGARAVVVNEQGAACPPGVVGEIYIRTPYRTHGYYGRPELTREVFIPNPFNTDPSDIVYKTGDLARITEGGDFELLGRKDQQVKIRGVRVELGEIENALREHEAVSDVVVVERADDAGDNSLCAYVVAGREVGLDALRAHLSRHLPVHMLPANFVRLDALPRTSSGKVDRAALPAPEAEGEEPGSYHTPFEEVVAGIWADVLGVARVGADDNFFELGGHSLRATLVVARLREALQVEMPLRRLFELQTVARLAAAVEEMRLGGGSAAALPPIVRAPRDAELPLSFAQERLWFLDQLEPGSASYNVPAAVRIKGRLDVAALRRALNEIVRRHEVLRTTFARAGGRPVQVVAEGGRLSPPLTDLGGLPGAEREAEVARLAAECAVRPFDLEAGLLVRAELLRLDSREHVLLFAMHHIAGDAWSMGVLVRELATLYEAFTRGEPSPLAELPVQYADYAVWQRGWLTPELLESQLAYWREQLAGAPRRPPDGPSSGGAPDGFAGARLYVELPDDLSAALRELSRREGVTLFMTLLAAYKVVLSYHARQHDILVGTPIFNRKPVETEGLIGLFLNTIVLRTSLAGNPSFGELLRRVRAVALDAYAHQDVPFEKLVEDLKPERRLNQNPLFQAAFTLDQVPPQELPLGELSLSAVAIETGLSQFDIVLHLADAGERLLGSLQYRTSLFDAEQMQRFLEHFLTVLRAAAARRESTLSELAEELAGADRRRWAEKKKEVNAVSLRKLSQARRRAGGTVTGDGT